jgi:hypothetical protein
MTIRGTAIAALGAAIALVVGAAPAHGAKVVNGGFERQSFAGWTETYYPDPDMPLGEWTLYSAIPRGLPPVPPQGTTAALTDQDNPSAQILSQVVRLREDRRHRLSFQLALANDAPDFFTPPTLAVDDPNQQFRMDVVKPGAPIKSVKPRHVLERVYRTEAGDPGTTGFRRVAANLTPYAGEKVRLRFAVVVTEAELVAAIDAVKVRTRR